jgi:tetratricopeptide (TPR) repeat protein
LPLDNARDAGQVRPLLPGSPGCLAVVTSRNQLTSLVAAEGAKPLLVDLLTTGEARQLLAARLGAGRVAAEPDAVDEVIDRCARLPLALAVAAARAALQPSAPLRRVAAELRDELSTLDALSSGDPATDARAIFSWSYQALSTGAARLFRMLGLHPGPDLSRPAAASLAALPVTELRPLLAELCGANLLSEHAPGRYAFHDLLRAYAAELASTHDGEGVRRAVRHRLLDHYLHTGVAAARMLNPHREPITVGDPQPGVTPEAIADDRQGLAWFAAEHHVLLTAITDAAAAGLDTHAWQLAWGIRAFLNRRGYWHSLRTTQHTALAVARRQGDLPGQAHSHRGTALACTNLGQHADAGEHLRRALELYGQLGDLVGQGHCHVNLGNLAAQLERHAEALRHGEEALELYVAAGSQAGEALALNGIGWSHAQLGDYQEALVHCQRSLVLSQQLADRRSEASTWDSLGYAHLRLGHHREAIRCYRHALELFAEHGDRFLQARAFAKLGEAHRVAGEPDPARARWRQALAILDELDHPEADQVRAKLHAAG